MRPVDREQLVACLSVPCAWQTDGTVHQCPYRSGPPSGQTGFPKQICRLFSTPGPHAESKIAETLGVSSSVVRRHWENGMKQIQIALEDELPFGRSVEEPDEAGGGE